MPDLTVKGTDVRFVLRGSKKVVTPPKSYGMIHDADGVGLLPRCTLLVGPFYRGPEVDPKTVPRAARKYLGQEYVPHRGRAQNMPLAYLDLSAWDEIGEVTRVDYRRTGDLNKPFFHDFARRVLLVIPARTMLYERGKWLRLELPWGCRLNERGFLAP